MSNPTSKSAKYQRAAVVCLTVAAAAGFVACRQGLVGTGIPGPASAGDHDGNAGLGGGPGASDQDAFGMGDPNPVGLGDTGPLNPGDHAQSDICSPDQLIIYPEPTGLAQANNLRRSTLFAVAIDSRETFVYESRNRQPSYSVIRGAHFVTFAFACNRVSVTVTKLGGNIGTAKVRPYSAGITPRIDGNKAEFEMTRPGKLMVQIDGDAEPLMLFADLPDTDVPANGAGVTRFGPGYHAIGDNYSIASGQTLYLDGGAVVAGTLEGDGTVTDFKLRGPGILYGGNLPWTHDGDPWDMGIFHADRLERSTIDGPVILDSPYYNFGFANADVVYHNLKIIGWEKNTDGIWVGPNTRVSNCFIMTDDDIVRPVSSPTYADSSHTLIEDVIVWHEGYGSLFKFPLYPWNSPYVQNITYRKIDVIRSELSSWGAVTTLVTAGSPSARLRNITFENITFEEISPQAGAFFAWEVPSGSSIENITFRNIRTPNTNGYMKGSADAPIDGVTFDGFYRGDTRVGSLSDLGVTANQYVTNVTFK